GDQVARGLAADRRVDQLDRVERGEGAAELAQLRGDLDQAAGVRARIDVGAGREHVLRLAAAELARGRRLDDVVDAGAPAADRLLGRLEHRQPGDRGERGARLGADALRVREVARVLEGDLEAEGT